ncbi:class I SAM-dependent methyltransferase [Nostoc sp.]|uniref:class I SAM-dependent methyltransferase n=1 Tax=Nostoc sp. TaxID=1180 RepID=UPI002FF92CCA
MIDSNRNQDYPDRSLRWLSSINPTSREESESLRLLQQKMQAYYSSFTDYYEKYVTHGPWKDESHLVYQDIISHICFINGNVLEIGCGTASILTNKKILHSSYTGIDFSEKLINNNQALYPDAHFLQLTDPNKLPFESNTFDFVLSVYVLEHTVFPHLFLDEVNRVLKKGGVLCVVCPNFLGKGKITSQRKGFSPGTGSKKLKEGKIFDAIVSSFDAKIRIPLLSHFYRKSALNKPQFFVNIQPVCFSDPFMPDVDAIYLTFEPEIKVYLGESFNFPTPNKSLQEFLDFYNLIYLLGYKH